MLTQISLISLLFTFALATIQQVTIPQNYSLTFDLTPTAHVSEDFPILEYRQNDKDTGKTLGLNFLIVISLTF